MGGAAENMGGGTLVSMTGLASGNDAGGGVRPRDAGPGDLLSLG